MTEISINLNTMEKEHIALWESKFKNIDEYFEINFNHKVIN